MPTNLIAPFAEGQIPQVILLGIVFGIALLMMGDSGKPIREALAKVKEWAMSVMMLIMKILPLLPFISTMTIVANGESTAFLQGWKYIAAAYICYLLTIAIEFVAVSVRCKRSVSDLLGMLKHVVAKGLMPSGSAEKMITSQDQHNVTARRHMFACRLFMPFIGPLTRIAWHPRPSAIPISLRENALS